MRHERSETARKQRTALHKSGQEEEEGGGRGVFVADVRVIKLGVGVGGRCGRRGIGGGRCTTSNAYASVDAMIITAVRLRKDLKLPIKQAQTKPNRQVQAHNSKCNKNVSERTYKRFFFFFLHKNTRG